jgi:hypothetical protein
MTDIEPARSSAVSGVEGMEDIGASDLVLPILKINHKDNGFQDSLTNEVKNPLRVVILGIVKQRILWPPEPGAEGEGPICRSYNFTSGIPDPDKFLRQVESAKGHPTGFARELIEAHGPLACGSCPLKDWGTHPRGDKPWCDEQWTVPLLVVGDDDSFSPALISFQRTSIKPIKNYVTSFASRKVPLYTSFTRIEGVQQFKGSNPYTVPRFVKEDDTDATMWPQFSSTYANIRAFIMTPRSFRDEDDAPVAPAPAPNGTPAPRPAATSEVTDAAPAGRAQPSSTPAAADDEVPF